MNAVLRAASAPALAACVGHHIGVERAVVAAMPQGGEDDVPPDEPAIPPGPGRLPLGIGRHHFFAFTSRSMALSSICSANSFFSLAFSASNARSFFASEGSIPPYLLLYL